MEYNIDDFIGVFKGYFNDNICQYAIDVIDRAENSGMVLTRKIAEGASPVMKQDISLPAETSIKLAHYGDVEEKFNEIFWSLIYPEYVNKYGILTSAKEHSIYGLKIQKTNKCEGYHVWHYEVMSRCNVGRIMTFILYLNDVEEGGETEFLYQSKRIKPEKGTLVLFPAGYTHTHRGNPPLSNTKYIITGWLEF